jgi:hypothetical protein
LGLVLLHLYASWLTFLAVSVATNLSEQPEPYLSGLAEVAVVTSDMVTRELTSGQRLFAAIAGE